LRHGAACLQAAAGVGVADMGFAQTAADGGSLSGGGCELEAGAVRVVRFPQRLLISPSTETLGTCLIRWLRPAQSRDLS
jgi:hypothetical protein